MTTEAWTRLGMFAGGVGVGVLLTLLVAWIIL